MTVEDTIHNLSDANFNIALPAIAKVNSGLRALAPKFGYSADDSATYNNSFRNPVMSDLTAERLFIIMTNEGLPGLEREVRKLIRAGLLTYLPHIQRSAHPSSAGPGPAAKRWERSQGSIAG